MTAAPPQRYDPRVRWLALIAFAGGVAAADPTTADRAADEAAALAAKGDFAGAAKRFRDAYRADPRPELMCNVGVSYYKAKDLPRAQRYLEQCVQIGASVDVNFISAVRQVLVSVDAALHAGELTPVSFLLQPAGSSITAVGNEPFDEPILGSRVVWFPWGKYSVVIHAEGYADQTVEIDAHDHEPVTKSIQLVAAPTLPLLPIIIQASSRSRVKPIAATVAAGVLGAGALAFYGFARLHATDANQAQSRPVYDDAVHSAHVWQGLSIGTLVLAAASGAAAVYLWTHHVDIEPTAHGAQVSLAGRF